MHILHHTSPILMQCVCRSRYALWTRSYSVSNCACVRAFCVLPSLNGSTKMNLLACVALTLDIAYARCLTAPCSLALAPTFMYFPVLQFYFGVYGVPLALEPTLYGTVGDKSGDNIGLVWWKMYMSRHRRCTPLHIVLLHHMH